MREFRARFAQDDGFAGGLKVTALPGDDSIESSNSPLLKQRAHTNVSLRV
jgi:hypothetical protein